MELSHLSFESTTWSNSIGTSSYQFQGIRLLHWETNSYILKLYVGDILKFLPLLFVTPFISIILNLRITVRQLARFSHSTLVDGISIFWIDWHFLQAWRTWHFRYYTFYIFGPVLIQKPIFNHSPCLFRATVRVSAVNLNFQLSGYGAWLEDKLNPYQSLFVSCAWLCYAHTNAYSFYRRHNKQQRQKGIIGKIRIPYRLAGNIWSTSTYKYNSGSHSAHPALF